MWAGMGKGCARISVLLVARSSFTFVGHCKFFQATSLSETTHVLPTNLGT